MKKTWKSFFWVVISFILVFIFCFEIITWGSFMYDFGKALANAPHRIPSEKYDLTDFDPAISEMSIGYMLIPEDFINLFGYTDGYFHFYVYNTGKKFAIFDTSDRLLLYFKYDSETYEQAKAYVFKNLELSKEVVKEYNEYFFYDVLTDPDAIRVPRSSKMFVCNDNKNTLLFMGWYTTEFFDENIDEKTLDEIIPEYFGDWYDFSS